MYKTRYMYNRKSTKISHRLILYCKEEGELKFLIQQRRDTFEYIDIIQGTWTDLNQLQRYFFLISNDERERIDRYKNSFEELWEDLHVNKHTKTYIENFDAAKKKFESIIHLIPIYLQKSSEHKTCDPPWVFPGGRKNSNSETNINCAIRETEEETRIPREEYTIVPPEEFNYVEKVQGTNGQFYVSYYYIAEVKSGIIPERMDLPGMIRDSTLSSEVEEVRWLTFDNACEFLTPKRKKILNSVINFIAKG